MRKNALRLATAFLCVSLLSACNLINSFQSTDDKAIITDIQAKLYQDPVLKTRNVQVASQKGVVVLTGTVSTALEKAAAERLSGEVKGVKQIMNQLDVSSALGAISAPPPPTMNAANNVRRASPPAREKSTRSPLRSSPEPRAAETTARSNAAEYEPVPPSRAQAPQAVAESAPPPEPERITIPPGTEISVRMIDGIDSSENKAGEEFAASVSSAVVVGDRVVIPKGSDARVRLMQAKSAGHLTGRSELHLELVEVTVNGTSYNVRSSAFSQAGASRGKRTAETVGGGAALGALIGAIAGKGKGAAIGAGVGAAAGTGVQAATKGEQVRIPSETKIDFTLTSALTVTM